MPPRDYAPPLTPDDRLLPHGYFLGEHVLQDEIEAEANQGPYYFPQDQLADPIGPGLVSILYNPNETEVGGGFPTAPTFSGNEVVASDNSVVPAPQASNVPNIDGEVPVNEGYILNPIYDADDESTDEEYYGDADLGYDPVPGHVVGHSIEPIDLSAPSAPVPMVTVAVPVVDHDGSPLSSDEYVNVEVPNGEINFPVPIRLAPPNPETHDENTELYRCVYFDRTTILHLEPRLVAGTIEHVAYHPFTAECLQVITSAHHNISDTGVEGVTEGVMDSRGNFHPIVALTRESLIRGHGYAYHVWHAIDPNNLSVVVRVLSNRFPMYLHFAPTPPPLLPRSISPLIFYTDVRNIEQALTEYVYSRAEPVFPLNSPLIAAAGIDVLSHIAHPDRDSQIAHPPHSQNPPSSSSPQEGHQDLQGESVLSVENLRYGTVSNTCHLHPLNQLLASLVDLHLRPDSGLLYLRSPNHYSFRDPDDNRSDSISRYLNAYLRRMATYWRVPQADTSSYPDLSFRDVNIIGLILISHLIRTHRCLVSRQHRIHTMYALRLSPESTPFSDAEWLQYIYLAASELCPDVFRPLDNSGRCFWNMIVETYRDRIANREGFTSTRNLEECDVYPGGSTSPQYFGVDRVHVDDTSRLRRSRRCYSTFPQTHGALRISDYSQVLCHTDPRQIIVSVNRGNLYSGVEALVSIRCPFLDLQAVSYNRNNSPTVGLFQNIPVYTSNNVPPAIPTFNIATIGSNSNGSYSTNAPTYSDVAPIPTANEQSSSQTNSANQWSASSYSTQSSNAILPDVAPQLPSSSEPEVAPQSSSSPPSDGPHTLPTSIAEVVLNLGTRLFRDFQNEGRIPDSCSCHDDPTLYFYGHDSLIRLGTNIIFTEIKVLFDLTNSDLNIIDVYDQVRQVFDSLHSETCHYCSGPLQPANGASSDVNDVQGDHSQFFDQETQATPSASNDLTVEPPVDQHLVFPVTADNGGEDPDTRQPSSPHDVNADAQQPSSSSPQSSTLPQLESSTALSSPQPGAPSSSFQDDDPVELICSMATEMFRDFQLRERIPISCSCPNDPGLYVYDNRNLVRMAANRIFVQIRGLFPPSISDAILDDINRRVTEVFDSLHSETCRYCFNRCQQSSGTSNDGDNLQHSQFDDKETQTTPTMQTISNDQIVDQSLVSPARPDTSETEPPLLPSSTQPQSSCQLYATAQPPCQPSASLHQSFGEIGDAAVQIFRDLQSHRLIPDSCSCHNYPDVYYVYKDMNIIRIASRMIHEDFKSSDPHLSNLELVEIYERVRDIFDSLHSETCRYCYNRLQQRSSGRFNASASRDHPQYSNQGTQTSPTNIDAPSDQTLQSIACQRPVSHAATDVSESNGDSGDQPSSSCSFQSGAADQTLSSSPIHLGDTPHTSSAAPDTSFSSPSQLVAGSQPPSSSNGDISAASYVSTEAIRILAGEMFQEFLGQEMIPITCICFDDPDLYIFGDTNMVRFASHRIFVRMNELFDPPISEVNMYDIYRLVREVFDSNHAEFCEYCRRRLQKQSGAQHNGGDLHQTSQDSQEHVSHLRQEPDSNPTTNDQQPSPGNDNVYTVYRLEAEWPPNNWIAISQDVTVSTSAIVPSQPPSSSSSSNLLAHHPQHEGPWGGDEVDGEILCRPADTPSNADFDKFRSLDFQLRFENLFTTSPDALTSPLPTFNWANSKDVWKNMVKKEQTFQRDHGMFKNHPELQPRMRSILLDWLSEVCEVYRLHKETFTLCVDFIDRYLSVTQDVAKTQLQLTGISALFIAAKLEEIYPPKLAEFAYVTDSACSETDIVRQEMIMLKALKWDLSPMTTNGWLGVFLQMANLDRIRDYEFGFVFPQFSSHAFIQISRLCDLCLMDAGSLKFRYSVIAAAAMYHHTNEQLVMEVSNFNWADLYPCVKWMAPFAKAILEVGQSPIKFFAHISAEDCHNIQTHNVDMTLVDRAQALQATFLEKEKLCPSSLDLSAQLVCLLTPQNTHSARQPSAGDSAVMNTTSNSSRDLTKGGDNSPNSSS